MKIDLKETIVSQGEEKLKNLRSQLAKGEIEIEKFDELKKQNLISTKKSMTIEIENISKMNDEKLFREGYIF